MVKAVARQVKDSDSIPVSFFFLKTRRSRETTARVRLRESERVKKDEERQKIQK